MYRGGMVDETLRGQLFFFYFFPNYAGDIRGHNIQGSRISPPHSPRGEKSWRDRNVWGTPGVQMRCVEYLWRAEKMRRSMYYVQSRTSNLEIALKL